MDYSERERRNRERRAKRRRQVLLSKIVIFVLLLLILATGIFLLTDLLGGKEKNPAGNSGNAGNVGQSEESTEKQTEEATESETETEPVTESQDVLAKAERMAMQYDYDGAIALLKENAEYATNAEMQEAVQRFETTKASCVSYPVDQVTHVFFHSMIVDTNRAWAKGAGDATVDGLNQVMTTMSEFEKIMNSMYEKGYVMVSPHDMCNVDENGNVTRGTIMLPEGKIPFVLSQDDVSYYHYQDGYGLADKLLIDDNGKVKNQYTDAEGNVLIGDYDMVPWIDTFVEAHPDFSYHGHKGVIALTGYNGVLGYRTDIAYKTREDLQDVQQLFFQNNPDFDEEDWNREREEATKVANAMKANGWEFASHTWGHMNVAQRSVEDIRTDNEKWQNYVASIVGETDIIIFAFGADIGDWMGYSTDNAKFNYLKSEGFNIFCNVDSTEYWVQFGNTYMRQGRRNLDGYRMYYNPEMLDDLFDATEVFDWSRPTPVPEM